jgi:hypothetical protein
MANNVGFLVSMILQHIFHFGNSLLERWYVIHETHATIYTFSSTMRKYV